MPIVSMSSKGQVVIPKEIRERIGLRQGTRVAIDVADGAVVLRPARVGAEGWRRWHGALRGARLLRALREEHAAEITRNARRRS